MSLTQYLTKPIARLALTATLALSPFLYDSKQEAIAQDFGGLAEKIEKTEKEKVVEIPESSYIKKEDWYFFKTPILKHPIRFSDGLYSTPTYVVDIFAHIEGRLFIPKIPVVDACDDMLEYAKANVGITLINKYPEVVLIIEKKMEKDNKIYGNVIVLADESFTKLINNSTIPLYIGLYADRTFKKYSLKKNLRFTKTNIGNIFGCEINLHIPINSFDPIIIHSRENLEDSFTSECEITEKQKKIFLEEKHDEWVNCENHGKGTTLVWFNYSPDNKIIEKLFE